MELILVFNRMVEKLALRAYSRKNPHYTYSGIFCWEKSLEKFRSLNCMIIVSNFTKKFDDIVMNTDEK